MRLHMSRVYNMGGAAGDAQNKTLEIAKSLGFHELYIFHFNSNSDSDVELSKRIDGTIASVWFGDIVVLQSPTWNEIRYERELVRKLKAYSGLKLVIFIHDIIPLMFNSGEDNLRQMIEIYNYADLIIVPSQKMLDFLLGRGLTVKKCIVQEIWDYPIRLELEMPKYHKRIFFSGNPERFPFLKEWNKKTKICLYAGGTFQLEGVNVELRGFQKEHKLLHDFSEGGYGLVWTSGEVNSYYHLLQPYKVASYLAAGIPVIQQKGLASEEIILKNRLGYIVESLEEADEFVQSVSEKEYNEMVNRISEFNFLVKNGWFTKKVLTDAIMWLLNDNFMK